MKDDLTKTAQILLLEYEGSSPISYLQRKLVISWNRAAEIYEELQKEKSKLLAAANFLRRFQDWRTGKDIRTMVEAGMEPAKITEAIDTILAHFGLPEPLTDCANCAHNSDNIKSSSTTGCQWALYRKECEYKEVE